VPEIHGLQARNRPTEGAPLMIPREFPPPIPDSEGVRHASIRTVV